MSKLEIICALSLGVILGSLYFFYLPPPGAVQASTSIESKSQNGPVIVELFTSEGCSSCPPADKLLSELIDKNGANIAPLSEHVSYWNYIGWDDPNSLPALDNRQYQYVSRLGLSSAYTPQVVVNGTEQTTGNDRTSVNEAIAKALKTPPLKLPMSASFKSERVLTVTIDMDYLKDRTGDLNLAVTESGITSIVRAGENSGHVLKHDAVVRVFKSKSLKSTRQDPIDIVLKPALNLSKLNLIAFIQDPRTGKIQYSRIVPASKWKQNNAVQ